jgi:putative transposase
MSVKSDQKIKLSMPYRKVVIATGEIYHIFNRGVEERDLFIDHRDYQRFIENMAYYQIHGIKPQFSRRKKSLLNSFDATNQRSVDLICYVLMPNHFHFLLKQLTDFGIVIFMTRLQNSYGRYFNTRHRRSGHLFQGPYKAVRIQTDGQLIHGSRYIHLNPLVSNLTQNLNDYGWSSYLEFIGKSSQNLCQKDTVLNFFGQPKVKEYEKFVLDQVDYARELERIKHLLIDQQF